MPGYTKASGETFLVIDGASLISDLTHYAFATSTAGSTGAFVLTGWRLAAGINNIQFQLSNGAFDAGSISLYGAP